MPTNDTPPTEDYRVTVARKTLADSKQADACEACRWWGHLEATVESLLRVIDEQAPGGAK